ncbi:hypothetical protein E2C01_041580 [Portunus trituberculatus]|uniref:Uncharacterized protein n=1 Tax=Portunus trituberculatus TaxID=210409 RepID=A0A5B7FMY9_PORTR|nr:hypothetical protein [Portunus trituberculatus]
MVVVHSSPPNRTSDHHPNATIGTRQHTASLRVVTQHGGDERKTRKMQPDLNQLHFTLEQQTHCSTLSRPN